MYRFIDFCFCFCLGIFILIFGLPIILIVGGLWIGVLVWLFSVTFPFMIFEGILMFFSYITTGKHWIEMVPGDAILFSAFPLVEWAELPEKLFNI